LRAPLSEAVGEGAHDYAASFLRGEGHDPTTEPGRVLVARIARFLSGSYARTLLDPGVEVRREVPFLVPLPCGASLRGTIDLLVVRRRDRDKPRVEIVDYKLRDGGRGDLVRYDLQLRAYAAAVALSIPDADVVAGIAFLGGEATPLWLDGLTASTSVAHIDEVARRFLRARASNVWPRIAHRGCDALRCGFRDLCWPGRGGGTLAKGEKGAIE
jgi:hypothetical protein